LLENELFLSTLQDIKTILKKEKFY
jgi:hypothetical protein